MLNFKKKIKNFAIKIRKINNIICIKKLYTEYLGKNGIANKMIKLLKNIPKNIKPKIGFKINKFKKIINKYIQIKKKHIINHNNKSDYIDIYLPGRNYLTYGNKHPISIIIDEIENFFINIGFENLYSKEIEDTYHNFEALNIDKYHPSRSIKDTFWIKKNILLRTHTTCSQIRFIKKRKIPIKIITSGYVFRKDHDKTHTPMFNQLDGFIIDENINFSNLKYLIEKFINYFFPLNTKIKFYPAYFPFTEPSAEVKIKDKNNKWLEILGCGIIHPKILNSNNINTKKYSGLAFGIGIERLIMLKFGITDIRKLYKNDIRLLNQF